MWSPNAALIEIALASSKMELIADGEMEASTEMMDVRLFGDVGEDCVAGGDHGRWNWPAGRFWKGLGKLSGLTGPPRYCSRPGLARTVSVLSELAEAKERIKNSKNLFKEKKGEKKRDKIGTYHRSMRQEAHRLHRQYLPNECSSV